MTHIKIKLLSIACVLMLFCSVSSNAQTVPDDPVLKACQETALKLQAAEVKISGLENENKLQVQLVDLGKEKLKFVEEKANYYKTAFENSEKIDNNSALIINNLRIEVASYKDELSRLRVENEKLRSSRNFRTLVGFGLGVGTGFIINK